MRKRMKVSWQTRRPVQYERGASSLAVLVQNFGAVAATPISFEKSRKTNCPSSGHGPTDMLRRRTAALEARSIRRGREADAAGKGDQSGLAVIDQSLRGWMPRVLAPPGTGIRRCGGRARICRQSCNLQWLKLHLTGGVAKSRQAPVGRGTKNPVKKQRDSTVMQSAEETIAKATGSISIVRKFHKDDAGLLRYREKHGSTGYVVSVRDWLHLYPLSSDRAGDRTPRHRHDDRDVPRWPHDKSGRQSVDHPDRVSADRAVVVADDRVLPAEGTWQLSFRGCCRGSGSAAPSSRSTRSRCRACLGTF
jgi:hypothetical protein